MKKLLVMVMSTLVLMSCGHKKDAKSFEKALEAETGQSYSIAKLHTLVGDYVVYKNETTGEFEAYNMKKWDRKENSSYQDFLSNGAQAGVDIVKMLDKESEYIESGYYADIYDTYYEYYEYYDDYCECWVEDYDTYSVWVGTEWVDTSYWATFYYGGGFKFSNTQGVSKDLELLESVKEKTQLGLVSFKLKNDYKLSASRALELAKLTTKYQKLESKRELTDSEKNEFATKALGVSFSDIEGALKSKKEGNTNKLDTLLKSAAKVNETSPENIGRFFEDLEESAL